MFKLNPKLLTEELEKLKDVYSTEEKIVGIWHDGRSIYRKVMSATYSEANRNFTLLNDIETIVNSSGWVKGSGGTKNTIPSVAFLQINTSNQLILNSSSITSVAYEVTVEYVKTTDTVLLLHFGKELHKQDTKYTVYMKINDKLTKDIRDRISNITGEILWTNPSPNSSFATQTITLSSDDYDMLEVIYYIWKDDKSIHSTKAPKGTKINLSGVIDFSESAMYYAVRNLSYVNNITLTAGNCRALRSGSTSTVESNNTACMIPIYIIGYKTGLF